MFDILLKGIDTCKKSINKKYLNLAKNCLTHERFFDLMIVDRTHICITCMQRNKNGCVQGIEGSLNDSKRRCCGAREQVQA